LEWEKMTGARVAAIESRIVLGETWLRSTIMPIRFISRTIALPNAGEAVMDGIVGRRIGPVVVLRVGEGHVAGAERMELAKRGGRVADLVAAFDPDQRRDPPGFLDAADVGGGRRHLQPPRIAGDHPVDDIDLLESHPDRLVALQRGRDPHRPELRPDPALPHPRQIGLEPALQPGRIGIEVERLAPEVVGLANFPRQVVMAVDHRRLREHALHPSLRRLSRSGGRSGDQGRGEQDRQAWNHGFIPFLKAA
jgi:hypothetical protein